MVKNDDLPPQIREYTNTIHRLQYRTKQITISLHNIQYELDTLQTILNAINEDLNQGEN